MLYNHYIKYANFIFRAFIRRLSLKWRRKLIVFALFVAIGLCWRWNSTEVPHDNSYKRHIVIISAIYSAKSKLYANHSIILLLNAPSHPLVASTTFRVNTKNKTAHQWSSITLTQAFSSVECLWTAYISVASSVERPNKMEIEYGGTSMAVKLQPSFDAKYVRVGTCFSPLFFAEHWQLINLSIGIYRHFGANLQVVYMMSAVDGIMELLELYSDVVQIEPWYSIRLNKPDMEQIGLDPNLELDWRNQATAHTDCLLKYREAAEFLIIADMDDVLIPTDLSTTYYEEFIRNDYPSQNVAAQLYTRFPAEISSTFSVSAFSLRDDLHSVKVALIQPMDDPKYVVNTSRAETLWIHRPVLIKVGTSIKQVLVRNGRMLHFRNWTFMWEKQQLTASMRTNSGKQNLVTWKPIPLLKSFLTARKIEEIGSEHEQLFNNKEQKIFRKLPQQQKYTNMFAKCYDVIFYGIDKQVKACPGPHRCQIPPISGLRCKIMRRNFHGRKLASDVIVYTASNPANLYRSKNGCSF